MSAGMIPWARASAIPSSDRKWRKRGGIGLSRTRHVPERGPGPSEPLVDGALDPKTAQPREEASGRRHLGPGRVGEAFGGGNVRDRTGPAHRLPNLGHIVLPGVWDQGRDEEGCAVRVDEIGPVEVPQEVEVGIQHDRRAGPTRPPVELHAVQQAREAIDVVAEGLTEKAERVHERR